MVSPHRSNQDSGRQRLNHRVMAISFRLSLAGGSSSTQQQHTLRRPRLRFGRAGALFSRFQGKRCRKLTGGGNCPIFLLIYSRQPKFRIMNCLKCRHDNPPNATFCMNCGTLLENRSAEDQSKSKGRKAERRQVTFLFCDLVNSTALSEKLDPEEYRSIIYRYHQVVEKVVKAYGGTIGNYLGDGLLVYFGYPKGQEDAPKASVNAALASIEALQHAHKNRKSNSPEVNVRIGIHTGLAVVDEHLALGSTVNIASRLEGLAPVNGVVISPQTRNLIEGWFETKSIGKHKLKGVDEPMEIFQVLKESGAHTRLEVSKRKGLSPLVGRESELHLLEDMWNDANKGNGRIILLSGEAGIGKSRLVDAFVENEIANSDAVSLSATSSANHTSSFFYPLIEMAGNQIFDFDLDDTSDDKLEKVKKYLEKTNTRDETSLPLLAEFLSIRSEQYSPLVMSPFAKRQKTMEIINNLLLEKAHTQTLLFILEDLHWTDASTLEWFSQFLEHVPQHRLLAVTTTRSIFSPSWEENELVSKISLERLSKEDTQKICLHQSRGKAIPENILDQISVKTEGVPLFIEELTKMLLESDYLQEKEESFEASGTIADLPIPATLQDSLIARLDQLSNAKELVQLSAVLGKEFSGKMLNALFPREKVKIDNSIHQLLEAEIFLDRTLGEDEYYSFKHSLIQDAAYDSILRSERKRMHSKVASVIEGQFTDVMADQPEILAHHYTKGDEPLQAIPFWLRAGQQANQKNANFEAINHLQKGLELLPLLDSEAERNNLELDYYLTLGGCYVVTHGFPHPKVKETFDIARNKATDIEVSPKLALILLNLMSYYFNVEDYESYDEIEKYSRTLFNHPKHGYWFALITKLPLGKPIAQGKFVEADRISVQALEIYNPELPFPWELTPTGHAEVTAKSWRMISLGTLGKYNLGNQLADHHLEYSKAHTDSVTLYHIYTFPALYKIEIREWQKGKEILEQYFPIARPFGDPVFNLTADVYYHIAKSFLGDDEAVVVTRQLIDTCFQIGFKAFASVVSTYLGEIYYQRKEFTTALEWTDQLIALVSSSGSLYKIAELHRLRGLILHALGRDQQEIEACFKQALTLASEQSAKTFELRATRDYAAFLSEIGRKEEGRKLLKEICGWFKDEYRTRDLKEAEDLLLKFN